MSTRHDRPQSPESPNVAIGEVYWIRREFHRVPWSARWVYSLPLLAVVFFASYLAASYSVLGDVAIGATSASRAVRLGVPLIVCTFVLLRSLYLLGLIHHPWRVICVEPARIVIRGLARTIEFARHDSEIAIRERPTSADPWLRVSRRDGVRHTVRLLPDDIPQILARWNVRDL